MSCQALGRCRICARKHKIAVFGSKEAQHFFIEKSNLKLIILNTVCVECIGRIENFVKKMDLDMIFNDYIKEEIIMRESVDSDSELKVSSDHPDYSETEETGVGENGTKKSVETVENSSRSTSTKVYNCNIDPAVKAEEKSKEAKNKTTSRANCCNDCDSSNDYVVASKTDVNAQPCPQHSGESQSAITLPHYSKSLDKIGQKRCGAETIDESDRKRPRILLDRGKRPVTPNSKNATLADSNLSSLARSSASVIAFVDCGRSNDESESLLGVRRGGRFLVCDFCEKEFTHAGDLNKHRRKHTGEKPYECNECKRKFAHASNLARHQRVHSGERPFSCPKCARTFTRRDKLMIHISAGRCLTNHGDDNIADNSSNIVLERTTVKTQS